MFNNIRNKIYNEIRERTSRYLLGNIGDVVDLGDELVCYVDKKKCDNWGYDYHINCVGINENNYSLANKYKLNKPVCYVIRNIDFGKGQVTIYGDNCKIIIDSCKFNDGLLIRQNGKCILKNSFIKCSDILSINASSLKLENTNISNNFSFFNNDKTDLSLKTNRDIEFVNSKLLKNGRNIEELRIQKLTDNHTINLLNNEIQNKNNEIAELKKVYENTQNKIDFIYQSKSWKIAEKLRKIRQMFK